MSNLKLSSIYTGKPLWAMVYHTQPDSTEIELVDNKFFESKKECKKYFKNNHKMKWFIQPEAVQFSGFNLLTTHKKDKKNV